MSEPVQRGSRWIRAAVVLFPAGLLLLGAGSFLIWTHLREEEAKTNYAFATAMRREPSQEAWQRHQRIALEALAGGGSRGAAELASYLDSSMGAENMGLTAERVALRGGLEAVRADVRGQQRPRELVVLLADTGADGVETGDAELKAGRIADLLSLANWLTGEVSGRTLRFLGVPLSGAPAEETAKMLENVAMDMRSREERPVHLVMDPATALLADEALDRALRIPPGGLMRHVLDGAADGGTGFDLDRLARLRERLLDLARVNR
jgi:hypothetical protein